MDPIRGSWEGQSEIEKSMTMEGETGAERKRVSHEIQFALDMTCHSPTDVGSL